MASLTVTMALDMKAATRMCSAGSSKVMRLFCASLAESFPFSSFSLLSRG